MYVSGVDSSFDSLTPDEAQNLKEAGVVVYYQCLWTAVSQPAFRAESLRAAADADLLIGAYISINGGSSGTYHVQQALANFPRDLWDQLKFVAIDVELRGIHLANIMEAIAEVKEQGQRPAIYTSHNIWHNYVTPANPPLPAMNGIPLINAYWDGDPDIDFNRLPFGGWKLEQVLAEQWSGGQFYQGQFVDRNTFNLDLLLKEEEHMPTPEYEELKGNMEQMHADLLKSIADVADISEDADFVTRKFFAEAVVSLNDRLNGLICTVKSLEALVATHFTTHNQSGGIVEKAGLEVLQEVHTLVNKAEEERDCILGGLNTLRTAFNNEEETEDATS